MKMVKSLLLGTAAGLVAMSGAQSLDIAAKPAGNDENPNTNDITLTGAPGEGGGGHNSPS